MTKCVDHKTRTGTARGPLVMYTAFALVCGVVMGIANSPLDGIFVFLILVAFGGFLFLRTRSGSEAAELLYDVDGDERQRLIRRRASEQTGNISALVAVVGWLVATALHRHGAATAFEIMAVVCGLTLIGTTIALSRSM